MLLLTKLTAYEEHLGLSPVFALVRDELPEPSRLSCAGRAFGVMSELGERAEQLGFEEGVVWVAGQLDATRPLARADLSRFKSDRDGFPVVVGAMWAGCLALVETDIGGNAAALVDGTLGRLVQRREPARLAASIPAESRDLAASFDASSRARRGAVAFSSRRCVWDNERAYDVLIERRTPPCVA